MQTRPAAEQRLNSEARKLVRQLQRAETVREKAAAETETCQALLDELHAATVARFGRELPRDALFLDVLALIWVDQDEYWHWLGMRNNKDLATFRDGRSERSVVRYLAEMFGLVSEDQWGVLYPTGDAEDVNPWHRVLRPGPRMGNPSRYGWVS